MNAKGDRTWAAVNGGALLGWVGIRPHPEDAMGEIYILAGDPDHQRTGVGTALIEHAAAQRRRDGMRIAMVGTGDNLGHAPSRASYEAAGFARWPVARFFRRL